MDLSIPLYGFGKQESRGQGGEGGGSFNSIVWILDVYGLLLGPPLTCSFNSIVWIRVNTPLVHIPVELLTFNSIVWIPAVYRGVERVG